MVLANAISVAGYVYRRSVSDSEVTTKLLQEIKNLGAAEQTRRKALPEEFAECSYCKGYHTVADPPSEAYKE